MSVVVPSNFSMGVIASSSNMSSLNFSGKDFSAYIHRIVFIYSGQYIFACGSNVLAPSVLIWIFFQKRHFDDDIQIHKILLSGWNPQLLI